MVGAGLPALRHAFQQLVGNRVGRFPGRQPGAVGDPKDMGVDGDGRLAERLVHHHVGGLAPDPGQLEQGVALARHLPAVIADQRLAQGHDILGLGVEQADRLDVLAHPIDAQGDHLRGRVGGGEQGGGCLVDPDVGRLGRQHDGDQQGKGIGVFQLGLRRRFLGRETAEELVDFGFFHGRYSTAKRSHGKS